MKRIRIETEPHATRRVSEGDGFDAAIHHLGKSYYPATSMNLIGFGGDGSEDQMETAVLLLARGDVGIHGSLAPEILRQFAQQATAMADIIDRNSVRAADAALRKAAGK